MPRKFLFSLIAILCMGVFTSPILEASAKEQKPVFTIMTEIKESTSNKNWDAAQQYAQKLKRYYEDRKWKFQIMADKTEYTTASSLISQVNAAIAAKDKTQTLVLLAQLHSLFQEMYRM